jgi:glycosyl transferase family 87
LSLRLALTGLFLISIEVSAYQVVWYFSHGPVVSDLRIFMTGVEIVRTGESQELYHFDEHQRVQTRLYPETKRAGVLAFNHLAYELLLYWPVAHLPYRTALMVWALMNLGLVLVIAWLLTPYTKALREATGLPVVLWLLAFYPVPYVLAEGQDSLIFLSLVVLSLRCAESGRTFLSGLLLALACFKFHLVLLIAFFAFFLPCKWRGLAGFATGSALVIGISRAIVGPSFAHDYISLLRNQEVRTPWGFVPGFMPNLRGFLSWALASWLDIGVIQPIVFVVSAGLVVSASGIILRSRSRQNESLYYAAAILSAGLVSYHLHMQDLTMAVLPMLILLDLAVRGKLSRAWTVGLVVAVTGLYAFRITAEFVPILLRHGCILAGPLLLLWLVSLRALDEAGFQESESAPAARLASAGME